jgi:hypothetical protein
MTASTSVAHYRGFSEQEPRLLNAFTQAPLSLFKFWIDGTLVSVVEGGEASGFEASKALAKHYKDAFRESPELVTCIDRAYGGAPVNATLELGGKLGMRDFSRPTTPRVVSWAWWPSSPMHQIDSPRFASCARWTFWLR